MSSATTDVRSIYNGLSLDDAFVAATIDQRFHALTDAGCNPVRALMLAVRVDVPLLPHYERRSAA